MRNRLFDIGVLQPVKLSVPVISVGNIALGGTGKTPFVLYLADLVRGIRRGRPLKVAILSRGYRGRGGEPLWVSDGRRILSDPYRAGDEPVMMAQAASGAVILVDRKRSRAGELAIAEGKAEVILLDDGFQHRWLHRDLDIVLLNAQDPLGKGLLFPAGYLREPVESLKRAHIIVLSKVTRDEDLLNRCQRLSQAFHKEVVASRFKPKAWIKVGEANPLKLDAVKGKKVCAFAGIAFPESFFKMLEGFGAEVVAAIPLPDHCGYPKYILDKIAGIYMRSRADWLVTTMKDAVKLPPIIRLLPVYALDIGIEILWGEDVLKKRIKEVLNLSQ